LLKHLERFDKLVQMQTRLEMPFLVPAAHQDSAHDQWTRTGEALLGAAHGAEIPAAVLQYAEMSSAYRQNQPAESNRPIADYRATLAGAIPTETHKARAEHYFNHLEPFYKAMVLYVAAFLFACGFWFNVAEPWRRSAAWLIVLAWVIHTTG